VFVQVNPDFTVACGHDDTHTAPVLLDTTPDYELKTRSVKQKKSMADTVDSGALVPEESGGRDQVMVPKLVGLGGSVGY
jgi:hypothetical protein